MIQPIPTPLDTSNALPMNRRELTKEHLDRFASLIYSGVNQTEKHLFNYQLIAAWRVVKSVIYNKGHEIFMAWARQSGKTETAAITALFLASAPAFIQRVISKSGEGRGWYPQEGGVDLCVFGPKLEQTRFIFDRVREYAQTGVLEENIPDLAVDVRSSSITMSGSILDTEWRSSITRSTLSDSATVEGATLTCFFVDEGQDVSDMRLLKSAYPMLITRNGTAVLLGSFTNERHGYFMEKVISLHRTRDYMIRRNCSLLDWTHRAKEDETYRIAVEGKIREFGTEDPYIRSQYFMLVDKERGLRKFIQEQDDLFSRRIGSIHLSSSEETSVGIDTAMSVDATIVTFIRRRDNHTMFWLDIRGTKYPEQERLIREALARYNVQAIVIESNAAGAALAQYLERPVEKGRNYGTIIHPIQTTRNSKAEMFANVLRIIKEGAFSYPEDDTEERRRFEKEFLELERKVDENGKLIINAPKIRGAHDDYPMSFALALTANRYVTPYIPEFTGEDKPHRSRNPGFRLSKRGDLGLGF